MKIPRKFSALFQRNQLDAEMNEEMRLHMELQTERNVAAGMSPDEARYAAQRQFGNVASVQERAREGRGWAWLEQFAQDFRFAVRSLAHAPAFTMVAVLILALGIGLVTIQFSLVAGALFQGLPFERADQILTIERVDATGPQRRSALRDFQAWRDRQVSLVHLGAHDRRVVEISGDGLQARSYRGAALSAGVLELLRTMPALGRGFVRDDERPDAPLVVLLGHGVWQGDFGGDPDIVGRAVRVRGEAATVIGVMPRGFAFPRNESIWINLRMPLPGVLAQDRGPAAEVVGRLGDRSTLETARAEFETLMAQTELTWEHDPAKRARPLLGRMLDRLNSTDIKVVMYSLLGIVGSVLALACLNVSNLLSARALQRGQELAVRSALGGSRGRILRLMLGESLLLAAAGAAGGTLMAIWAVPVLDLGLTVSSRPFWVRFDVDYRVLAMTAVLTVLVGILAGIFPALRATRRSAGEMLKSTGGTGGTRSAGIGVLNRWLVMIQVGMSCMVLTATSVLIDGARQRTAIGHALGADRMLTAQLRLNTPALAAGPARERFFAALLQRLRTEPGVTAAGITSNLPFGVNGMPLDVRDRVAADGVPLPGGFLNAVSAGYFAATGTPLLAGREFTESDRAGSENVAVISESLARQLWPGESALGRQLRPHRDDAPGKESWLTIVGVVADLQVDGPDFRAGIHVPLNQHLPTEVVVVLAAGLEPLALARPLRDAVRGLDDQVPVDRVFTFAGRIEDDLKLLVTFGQLALVFGLGALVLATVGVYGVAHFSVQRRTRELGLRMALGARPADVLQLVLKGGVKQCAAGLLGGGSLGWLIARPLQNVLANIQAPVSSAAYVVVAGIISGAVLLALWLPARRAAKVDPMLALRAE